MLTHVDSKYFSELEICYWVYKHVLINTYLNFALPKYYHLPLICTNKRTKLSKRFMKTNGGMLNLEIMPKVIMKYLTSIVNNN
ncbi:MAG: hypothetical protein ACKESC_01080, partial [Candidatus Hodgkinia cicadicola]